MATLDRAIQIAAKAHEGQQDKAGKPYILHPIRVMAKQKTIDEMMVAVLHDVVEDGTVTLDDLRKEGFSEKVVAGVDAVTRRKGEKYLSEFIERVKESDYGISVKLADLEDNMDPARAMDIPGWESLLLKYRKAHMTLTLHRDLTFKEKELKRLREAEE